SSESFDEFKKAMLDLGYEIKGGKHIAFRAKGQERFTRAKTLGDDYTQENIAARIENSRSVTENKRQIVDLSLIKKLPFTVDKQLLYAARRKKISDVKSLANTLMMIRNENILNRNDFVIRIDDLKAQALTIKEDIKKLNNKVESYRKVAKYLATVNKHKEVYMKYKKFSLLGKKEFYSRYEGDILSYKHAMVRLKQLNINPDTPLEKIVSLVNEYKFQVDVLSNDFNVLEKRIEIIRNAREVVNNIRHKRVDIRLEQNSKEEKFVDNIFP
ncbi:MAG: hypothetical protein GX660_00870, partial [Clostridiaceae bacterium]|nr:hypothetical protein [Clostridiaceae bacterium]